MYFKEIVQTDFEFGPISALKTVQDSRSDEFCDCKMSAKEHSSKCCIPRYMQATHLSSYSIKLVSSVSAETPSRADIESRSIISTNRCNILISRAASDNIG